MIRELRSIFQDSPNSFEGQSAGERVILLLRRHPFTILIRIVLFALFSIAPLVATIMFWSFLTTKDLTDLVLFALSIWYLIFWLGIFYSLTMYTLDTVIITDHRIIESDQCGLFNRKVSELHSNRIQDVSVKTVGIIETFLNFGNITVQTAASEKQFIFHQIPKPEIVKDAIMQLASTRTSGVRPSASAG